MSFRSGIPREALDDAAGEPTTGSFLRRARVESGYTAKTVARVLGVSQAYLCDIERDRRSLPVHRVQEFALVYSVDAAELFALVVPIPDGYRLTPAAPPRRPEGDR